MQFKCNLMFMCWQELKWTPRQIHFLINMYVLKSLLLALEPEYWTCQSALLGLLSEWQAQLTVKSSRTPNWLFWAVHSTDSFYHLMQEIKGPFYPWTIPELLQLIQRVSTSHSSVKFNRKHFNWLWFPPWQEGDTSE